MTTPFWALSLAYWLHMVATIIWIGGLAALAILVLPLARRTLDAKAYPAFLGSLQKRLDPLAWISLLVLVATGLFQMSANPNYEGFLTFTNRWAAAILSKHIVFAGMIGVSAYITWGILPKMQRVAMRYALREESEGGEIPEVKELQRQNIFLLRLNLVLGVLVLGLTALARASS